MEKATKILPVAGIIVGIIGIVVLLVMGYQPCKLTIFGIEFPLKCDASTIPTIPPTPKAECPSGITCYDDNFSALNPARWCKIPNEGIDFKNNQLFVSVPAETSRELHPCEFLDSNLNFVEVTLNIIQADGYAGNAHAGIGASLNNDEYLYLQLDSAGKAILTHGLGGQSSQVDETVSLDNLNAPHTLRVEWSGEKVLFFVDGKKLATQMNSKIYGHWFLITVSAWSDANITARLDNVRWGVASP
jgi:hypothetical protein